MKIIINDEHEQIKVREKELKQEHVSNWMKVKQRQLKLQKREKRQQKMLENK